MMGISPNMNIGVMMQMYRMVLMTLAMVPRYPRTVWGICSSIV
jgi:hypothetical protein